MIAGSATTVVMPQERYSYLNMQQFLPFRNDVELDPVDGPRQRHASEEEDDQDDIRKRRGHVDNLQI